MHCAHSVCHMMYVVHSIFEFQALVAEVVQSCHVAVRVAGLAIVNPPALTLDLQGFHSSRILFLKGGIPKFTKSILYMGSTL